jgi:hypothetical protein
VKSDAQTKSAERDARSFLLIGRNILGKSRTEKLFVRRRETKNAVEIITNGGSFQFSVSGFEFPASATKAFPNVSSRASIRS